MALSLGGDYCGSVWRPSLKASDGLSKLWPSLLMIVAYGISFCFLSLTLRTIPVGIAYAVWSGVGMVMITLVGWLYFEQRLDDPQFWKYSSLSVAS